MSDNELDAELLALAGGDGSSSEDEDVRSSPKRKSVLRDRADSEDRSPPRRGVASKLKSRAKARQSRADSDDEDQGFSSPRSEDHGAAADDIDDDAPLYPIEGKFQSESDRTRIMAMTEIQREEILAERALQVQKRTQDQQLRRMLSKQRSTDSDRKRKANDVDLDESSRKSSRPKTKASETLEAYKRQRELKGAQRARGEQRRKERELSEEGGMSEEDADGESEVGWGDRQRTPEKAREEPPPELKDFERIRVGRSNFVKVCFYPTFESLIKNCYCRVSVGMEGGQAYKMCQIKGFKQGRPYAMEGPMGKKVYTNQYVLAGQGKKEKEYPFTACSDGHFSEAEFADFRNALAAETVRFPKKSFTEGKLEDIHALLGHQWTDKDIEEKLKKQNAMKDDFFNHGRNRIVKRRDEAASRGDDAVVAKCNQELAAYDAGGSAKVEAKPNTPSKLAQQERLSELNRQNRKRNTEEVRKAQLAAKRAEQKHREEAIARAKKAEAEKKATAGNGNLAIPDDLFGDASDISRTGTPGTTTPNRTSSRAGTPAANGEKKKFGQFRKKAIDDDVIAGIDLGIDIDI